MVKRSVDSKAFAMAGKSVDGWAAKKAVSMVVLTAAAPAETKDVYSAVNSAQQSADLTV